MEIKSENFPISKPGFMTLAGDKLRAFGKRKDGAAAVEFAFVAPIMLSLYFGAMELSQGIEVNKKVGRAASLIGDLVTQQAVVTKADIVGIANIAAATLQPYRRTAPTVELVGIQVTNDAPPKAKVVWSQQVIVPKDAPAASGTSFLTVGSDITIPTELLIPNTFIIQGKLTINYLPFTAYQIQTNTGEGKGIPMGEKYYLRPRVSTTINCPDC
jgi:Flp pilus assembly protein TadG